MAAFVVAAAASSDDSALPVRQYTRDIASRLTSTALLVLLAETGSGKSTQLASILIDNAGQWRVPLTGGAQPSSTEEKDDDRALPVCRVAVTQPRRVAAVSVASRVARERHGKVGEEVGYAVRFEDMTSSSTKIKFVTDGMLLREASADPHLRQYDAIVLDEAHERSLSTDILLGMLKRAALSREAVDVRRRTTRREPLRVVVASATLDAERFSAYLNDCPVMRIPGRLHPVTTVHATSRPPEGRHVESAAIACFDAHQNEPLPGDTLCFLSGREEVERCCKLLRDMVSQSDDPRLADLVVLPLYAALPPDQQARALLSTEEVAAALQQGSNGRAFRRCIVATNVAETSLTVPGITVVVDTGKVKSKSYDPATGVEALKLVDASIASINQRAGRAGRTCAGKCYRLFPKPESEAIALARENGGGGGSADAPLPRPAEDIPEIQRSSLLGVALFLKTAVGEGVDILAFDFLDKPSEASLEDCLRQLHALGCIDAAGAVTALGREVARYPVDPPLGCAIAHARRLGVVDDMCAVAAMSSANSDGRLLVTTPPSLPPGSSTGQQQQQQQQQQRPLYAEERYGDHLLYLALFRGYDALPTRPGDFVPLERARRAPCPLVAADRPPRTRAEFLRKNSLDERGMRFALDVHRQLMTLCNGSGASQADRSESRTSRGVDPTYTALRYALCLGMANRIAERHPRHNAYRTLNDAGLVCELKSQSHPELFMSSEPELDGAALQRAALDSIVPVPRRVNIGDGLGPAFVVYQELATGAGPGSVPRIRHVSKVNVAWVQPMMSRLKGADVAKLSGEKAASSIKVENDVSASTVPAAKQENDGVLAGDALASKAPALDAARERYLARKRQATTSISSMKKLKR